MNAKQVQSHNARVIDNVRESVAEDSILADLDKGINIAIRVAVVMTVLIFAGTIIGFITILDDVHNGMSAYVGVRFAIAMIFSAGVWAVLLGFGCLALRIERNTRK